MPADLAFGAAGTPEIADGRLLTASSLGGEQSVLVLFLFF